MPKKWRELYDRLPAERRARIEEQVGRDLVQIERDRCVGRGEPAGRRRVMGELYGDGRLMNSQGGAIVFWAVVIVVVIVVVMILWAWRA